MTSSVIGQKAAPAIIIVSLSAMTNHRKMVRLPQRGQIPRLNGSQENKPLEGIQSYLEDIEGV